MENNTNEMLNYVKQKALKNYFNSEHSFFDLFPEEDFDFTNSNYTHFLYFDKLEGKQFLLDFLLFVKKYYNNEVFYYENYFSILNEFKKHLENNNVFFYTKTKMGLDIANGNNEYLLNKLKSLFGETHFVGDSKKIAFNEVVIKDKTSFTYDFFNYLIEKLNGYNYANYLIETLSNNTLNKIKNYYKGIPYGENLPFFLDTTKPYTKETKKFVIENIVTVNPIKVFAVSKDNICVSIIVVNINNNVAELKILCDSEYYDTQFDEAINYICYYLFNNFEISKISTINENKGISFSGINSSLVIAQFKPDYSLDSNNDGYSKIKYEISKDSFEESYVKLDNSIIKFNF